MAKRKGKVVRKAAKPPGRGRAKARRQPAPRPVLSGAAPDPAQSAVTADVDTQAHLPGFPVVGIGASAGGLEAYSQILEALPIDLGVALILVQHLAPRHESALPEILGLNSRLPVVQVTNGMTIEPNHVYVIPPNTQMGILEGTLRLMPRPADSSQHKPVDFFLRALAAYAQSQAIGVILSGTDSDGAVGIREVKGFGGITIAQDPKSARYDGMPRAAIQTGMVDLVLSPADIARELVRIAQHPFVRRPKPAEGDGELPSMEEHLQRVFVMLRNASGVDFTHYKQPTIKRRLQRRMVLHKIVGIDQYVKFLQQTPAEVRALYQDLLIHVTRFFRDPESYKALETHVFPRIVADRGQDQPVRIWVPGCSTGEEAYSVAIALLEFLQDDGRGVQVQIFATDVAETALEHARAGVYPDSIGGDVSPERLRRFFTKTDGSYRVSKTVRDLCVFARQDLTRDPPFSRLDLIVCRNVLIYLGPVLQRKLMNVFHYAIKPNGFLMLGAAETIGAHSDLFAVADKKHRLYTKKLTSALGGADFPPMDYTRDRREAGRKAPADVRVPGNFQNAANRLILSRYSPPGVIVDDELQIVQFRGQTGAFLEPAPGDASLNLLKMSREGLLHGLRSALHEARRNNLTARKEGLRVKYNGHFRDVNVEVLPLGGGGEGRHFLVLFEDVTARPAAGAQGQPSKGKRRAAKPPDERQVARLQEELAASRDYLQSIIQDLEAANEELQSANEEILSSNEELQSTNEELDTAKEELQSTNEELNTVNEELQSRNEELSRVNSDLVNLLGSVQIAIVIVSGDLRIRRFTPMAEKVLNVIRTDVGRPISDIKPNIDCPDLEKLIVEAVETVSTKEREVRDRNGVWYALRIRPYKNVENRIDGAVLALFDIDAARRQEIAAREAREYADAIVDTVREPLLVLDSELRVRRANVSFWKTFQTNPADTQDRPFYELGNRQWDIPQLRQQLREIVPHAGTVEDYRVEHEFPGIGRRVMLVNARALRGSEGRDGMILVAFEDVTERGRTPAEKS